MPSGENKTFTCPNPSCKATCATPLKTLNLKKNPSEPYYACPYCLTEINAPPLKSQEKALQPQKETATKSSGDPKLEGSVGDKLSECQFHLGYLSERREKEQIPEDCLVCKSIVECMLKKMYDDQ